MDRRTRARRDADIVVTVLGGSTHRAAAKRFSVSERTVREKVRQWREGRLELWRSSPELLDQETMRVHLAIKALHEAGIGVTSIRVKCALATRLARLQTAQVAFARASRDVEGPPRRLPCRPEFMEELNRSLRRFLARRRVDPRTIEAVTEETMRIFDRSGGDQMWLVLGQAAEARPDS
jgi:hypothetical protein